MQNIYFLGTQMKKLFLRRLKPKGDIFARAKNIFKPKIKFPYILERPVVHSNI